MPRHVRSGEKWRAASAEAVASRVPPLCSSSGARVSHPVAFGPSAAPSRGSRREEARECGTCLARAAHRLAFPSWARSIELRRCFRAQKPGRTFPIVVPGVGARRRVGSRSAAHARVTCPCTNGALPRNEIEAGLYRTDRRYELRLTQNPYHSLITGRRRDGKGCPVAVGSF
jgi:hypothetical protein